MGKYKIGSVRARVTLGAVSVVALAFLVAGVFSVSFIKQSMIREAQAVAEAQAESLAIMVEVGRVEAELDADISSGSVLQVVQVDGPVLAASPEVKHLQPFMQSLPSGKRTEAVNLRVDDANGGSMDYRLVALEVFSPEGPVIVAAGVPLTNSEKTLKIFVQTLILGSGAMLVVVAAATWWVTGRALQPVEEIREEVARFSQEDLKARVRVPEQQDEVHRLANTMNLMLDRLEDATMQQRRFIADAAHEIRSPLASLRAQLEVAVEHPQGLDAQSLATDALEDVDRLHRLATDLLSLARLDAGETPPPTSIDMVEELASLLSERAGDRVEITMPQPTRAMWVQAPSDAVRRILTNLIDNAVRHADTSVDITITASEEQGVTVTVTDDGPGIPPADRELIFERFARLDDARSRHTGGTGLGLAIAKELAQAAQGSLQMTGPSSFALTLEGSAKHSGRDR